MMSLVDACLGRLPGPAALHSRPLLRLLQPARSAGNGMASLSYRQQFVQSPAAVVARHTHALAVPAAAEDFFASSAVTFSGMGLADELCSALKHAGYPQPAHAQELAVPVILEGKDVVLAAETGSGKTLAYLAPLIHLALRSNQAEAAVAAERTEADGPEAQGTWQRQRQWRPHPTAALVLCPNAALCEQVVAAAHALKDPESGAPLAAVAFVSAQSPPPVRLPDIVVSTPGGLLSLLDSGGPAYGYEWTRAGLASWARRVVFDESDLLLSGGYGAQMRIIWDALRAGDRTHAARRICLQVGITEAEFSELPRHLKLAAQKGGAEGLLEAGFKPRAQQQQQQPADGSSQQQQAGQQEQGVQQAEGQAGQAGGEQEVRGVHGPSWKRQYMFVAATMPAEGDTSVGAQLLARFPQAAWLTGRQLHQSKRALLHRWQRVEDEAHRSQMLQEVVAGDEQLAAGTGRMLVFARDVASAQATAEALQGASEVAVLQYHKGVSSADRAAALVQLSSEQGLVMVCTDAAARGLDVPDVTHVVQADFAHSAVDFLHRVGRTARAGKGGRVTSLYTPDCEPLVDAIRDNIAAGTPVEGAFSRKRSFRKKFRKYGEYVARGKEGPQENMQQYKAGLAERAAVRRSERRW